MGTFRLGALVGSLFVQAELSDAIARSWHLCPGASVPWPNPPSVGWLAFQDYLCGHCVGKLTEGSVPGSAAPFAVIEMSLSPYPSV